MYDLAYIEEMQREAAAIAANNKHEPFMLHPEDVGNIKVLRLLPFIGDHLPEGWERVEPDSIKPNRTRPFSNMLDGVGMLWVDSSGLGREDEPAMTMREFAAWAVPNYGYAITVAGQFQVGIGVFRRKTNA